MINTACKIMLLIVGVFVLLFLIAYFWPDEDLHPDTEELLRLTASQIQPEQNAYFTFYGMDAPLDQDAHVVGYEKAMALNQASAKLLKTGNLAVIPDAKWEETPLTKEDDEGTLCKPVKEACFDKFLAKHNEIRQLTQKHAILLARYKHLYQRPHFYHAVVPSAFTNIGLPNFLLYTRLHRLLLAEIGCDYLKKNKRDAFQALQQDILYLRGILADANVLITRAIIISMLKSDLHLYAQMLDLQDTPPEAFHWNLPLLNENERKLDHVVKYEFGIPASLYDMLAAHRRIAVNEFEDISKWKKMLLCILPFKRNAMLNLAAPAYLRIAEMSHLSAPEAVAAEKKSASRPKMREYLTNAAGVLLYDDAFPGFSSSVFRTHALDGLIRLVNLKQRILAQRIRDDRIPEFLQEQAADYGDPYTGQAMRWDANRRTIGFFSPFKPQTSVDEIHLPEFRQE